VLHLKASWTKGGKERDIPIRTEAQRELLHEATQLADAGSLIPADMSYKDQLNRFQGAGCAGRHRSRPRAAAPLRADALRGADGLEGAGWGWSDFQAIECGSEGDRPASADDDLARTGARA
jgi:Integrase